MSEWFVEQDDEVLNFGYKVEKCLFSQKSLFQKIDVYQTKVYGKILVIDGCVMMSDADEFVYHEMISHIPVCYHSNPKDILVIGGGDGGTLRELSKHSEVKKIVLCEIDKMVIDVSKKFFPKVACGFDEPNVELKVADGIKYIENHKDCFDVVIVDSTDPVGPGEGLFTAEFYGSVRKALRKDGVLVIQSESPWFKESLLQGIYQKLSHSFQIIRPYVAPIPTYPRGLWSWTLASNRTDINFCENRFSVVENSLQYLTRTVAKNVFEIPPFYRKKLGIL